MKDNPPNTRLSGCASRCHARVSSAAPRLARTIARVTGMYLVVPEVVPEDKAR